MAKEIKLNLKKNEMDQIIKSQKEEQQPRDTSNDFQQFVKNLQIQQEQMKLRIMTEQLLNAQLTNINQLVTTIANSTDHDIRTSLERILSGYVKEDAPVVKKDSETNQQ